jgi:hypothetical protein
MEKLIIAAAVVAAIAFYAANAAPLPRQSRTVDPEKLPDGSICHTRLSKIVIASEAKQSTAPPAEKWIASSLSLLAMTVCPEGQTCPAPTGKSVRQSRERLSSPPAENISLSRLGKSVV